MAPFPLGQLTRSQSQPRNDLKSPETAAPSASSLALANPKSDNADGIGVAAHLQQEKGTSSQLHGKAPILFPVKLYSTLDRMEADGVTDIASWQPHGRSFIVRKPGEFKALIPVNLPTINNIKSFQRQVSEND
jgi:HSF-type DNA-binding